MISQHKKHILYSFEAIGLIVILLCASLPPASSTYAAAPGSTAYNSMESNDINWIEKAAPPVPVTSYGYGILNGEIILVGGEQNGVSTTTVQIYSPKTNSWNVDTGHGGTLAPLPQPRSFGFFCGAISARLHCMGGWQNGTYKGDHFVYSYDSNTWSTGPALPSYPIGQFSTTYNNTILVFGGWWGSYQSTVYQYSEGSGWSTKSPLPTPRAHGTAAVYNGHVYVIGGIGGQSGQQLPLNVVEMYDPASNSWTTKAPLPTPLGYLGWSGTPEIGGIIYIASGTTSYGYNPDSNTWQAYTSLPFPAGTSTMAVNGVLYVVTPQHTLQGALYPSVSLSWAEIAPMPVQVNVFASAIAGDMLYIIGGELNGSSTTTVQRYNPANNSWDVDTGHGGFLAPLPAPRSFFMNCSTLNGRIHCAGGWQNGAYEGDQYIYAPSTNSWSTGSPLPNYPIGQFSAAVNDAWVITGGWWGSFFNTTFQFTDAAGWVTKASMPTARNHGTAAAIDNSIFEIAGCNGSPSNIVPHDMVEVYDPATNAWATGLEKMPSEQCYIYPTAPVYNGVGYVIAGDFAYGYNAAADTWQTITTPPTAGYGVAVINGVLYALNSQHFYQALLPGAGTVDLSIDPPTPTVVQDQTFDLTLQAAAGSQNVDSVDSSISFDPSYLRVVDANGNEANQIIPGTSLPTVLANTVDNTTGRIIYSAGILGGTPPSGNFVIATIHFKVVNHGGDQLQTPVQYLSGTDVYWQGNSVLHMTMNSSVTVLPETPLRGQVSLQGRGNPPSIRWQGYPLTVTLNSDSCNNPVASYSTAIDASGAFTITQALPGTYYVVVKNAHSLSNCRAMVNIPTASPVDLGGLLEGDANNNDIINGADFSLLATSYLCQQAQPCWTATQADRVDFNNDLVVNGADFSLLATNYLKQGPIIISGGMAMQSSNPVSMVDLSIEPSPSHASIGQVFSIDLSVSAHGQPVQAIDTVVAYDPQYLQVVDAQGNETNAVEPGSVLGTILFNQVDNNQGRILYSAGQLQGDYPDGAFVLATVHFKVIAELRTAVEIAYLNGSDVYYQGQSVLGNLVAGQVTEFELIKEYLPSLFNR